MARITVRVQDGVLRIDGLEPDAEIGCLTDAGLDYVVGGRIYNLIRRYSALPRRAKALAIQATMIAAGLLKPTKRWDAWHLSDAELNGLRRSLRSVGLRDVDLRPLPQHSALATPSAVGDSLALIASRLGGCPQS